MTSTPTPRPLPNSRPCPPGATGADTGAPAPTGWLSAHPVPLPVFAARIGYRPPVSLADALRHLGVLHADGHRNDPRPAPGCAAWFDFGQFQSEQDGPASELLLNPAGQVAVLVALNHAGHELPEPRPGPAGHADEPRAGERA